MRISCLAPGERRCLASRWLFACHGHLTLSGAGLFLGEERLPATSCDAIPPGGASLSAGKLRPARQGNFPHPYRLSRGDPVFLADPVHSVRADAANGAWSELIK
jgi:hypothetical protein